MKVNIINDSINKLFNTTLNNFIFIYTPPKVGSTTLVTSLRVSLNNDYNVIHIHDEIMLNVLTSIKDVTINDIIIHLANLKKKIYVIDVYRTPIERKMSEFFEKISQYHFNNTSENINKYSIERIYNRFNKVFPHIGNGDHYFEKYNIDPITFDFNKKFSLQIVNNITYIKLRLCDSKLWSSILSTIFKTNIVIINDYNTENKSIGELYNKFKINYKLPSNYIENIEKDKYLNFYYNEMERKKYLDSWKNRLTIECTPYTKEEYNFYINIALENQYINDIDTEHYIDNGCFCKYCTIKRKEIYLMAKSGVTKFDKIIHNNVINEFNNEQKKQLDQLNSKKYRQNQFKINHFL